MRIGSTIIFYLSELQYEKPSSSYCVMKYCLWECRRNLNLITLGSERVNFMKPVDSHSHPRDSANHSALPRWVTPPDPHRPQESADHTPPLLGTHPWSSASSAHRTRAGRTWPWSRSAPRRPGSRTSSSPRGTVSSRSCRPGRTWARTRRARHARCAAWLGRASSLAGKKR